MNTVHRIRYIFSWRYTLPLNRTIKLPSTFTDISINQEHYWWAFIVVAIMTEYQNRKIVIQPSSQKKKLSDIHYTAHHEPPGTAFLFHYKSISQTVSPVPLWVPKQLTRRTISPHFQHSHGKLSTYNRYKCDHHLTVWKAFKKLSFTLSKIFFTQSKHGVVSGVPSTQSLGNTVLRYNFGIRIYGLSLGRFLCKVNA
jgi:hypothetical protein